MEREVSGNDDVNEKSTRAKKQKKKEERSKSRKRCGWKRTRRG
jgi:hypothetical protein